MKNSKRNPISVQVWMTEQDGKRTIDAFIPDWLEYHKAEFFKGDHKIVVLNGEKYYLAVSSPRPEGKLYVQYQQGHVKNQYHNH